MKSVLALLIPVLFVSQAFASDITAQNIEGKYRLDAKAFGKSATFRLIVINSTEFEIQRIFPDHEGKVCNGTYTIQKEDRHWPLKDVTYFSGSGSCPDDRSKIVTAKINFKQASLKDIHQGTNVAVTSSLAAGFTVNAHMQAE